MTVTFNAIFGRFDNGYVYVDHSGVNGVRELYLEMGGVKNHIQAEGFAAAILRATGSSKSTTAISGTVLEISQIPGLSYKPNDKMGGRSIASLTISQLGQNATVSVVPELDDAGITALNSINRRLAVIASGATAEFGRPAIQAVDNSSGTDTTPPPFSLDGPLVESYSPAWKCPRPFMVSWLECELVVRGTSETTITLYSYNGEFASAPENVMAVVTIPAYSTRAIGFVNHQIKRGNSLLVLLTTPGTGAEKLTVTPRGVMI